MSNEVDGKCQGTFSCGTMITKCYRQGKARKCGLILCERCARWNRYRMDTRPK